MKISEIFKALDLAVEAKKQGLTFIPCLVGHAGLGKSQGVLEWAAKNGYQVLDLRLALKEACDLIGYPRWVTLADGTDITKFATPSYLPRSGKWVIFLDEINRGNNSVMNAVFQLLTEGKLGDEYTVPSECIIACAMNPDTEHYGVSAVDQALADRLVMYQVEYDPKDFLAFAKANFHTRVVNFIQSGWTYISPEQLQKDDQYVSPRTIHRLSTFEKAYEKLYGANDEKHKDFHRLNCISILGSKQGQAYHTLVYNERPVSVSDILTDKSKAFKQLAKQSNPSNYKSDLINTTVEEILSEFNGSMSSAGINLDLVFEVCKVIPAEKSSQLLIRILQAKGNKFSRTDVFNKLKNDKELSSLMVSSLNEHIN